MMELHPTPHHVRCPQMGFTLIEGLITIVIAVIIAAIAVPTFQAMIEKSRVKGAAEAVYSTLQFARSESVKQFRDLNVIVDADTWCVGVDLTACDCSAAGNCLKQVIGAEFPAITMATSNASLDFESRRGTLSGTGGTVSLSSANGYQVSIEVSRLGRIQICSGNVGGYPACD